MVDFDKTGFVIASEKSGYRHLYRYDYSGAFRRQITKGEFNVTEYYGSNALGVHYFQTTQLGAVNRNVASVDAKGIVTLLNKETGWASASFSGNKSYYVMSYSNALVPPKYAVYTSKGVKLHELESNKSYSERFSSCPAMELLTVKNSEGEDMDAYLIKPVDFDPSKKYPLLMYQYNGPDSQEVRNRWDIDGLRWIAQNGIVVACVDGRGTGNKSRKWSTSVYKRLGHFETIDQLAGARYFSSLPYIDSSKTACFGWSYGGYMTLMEMGHPDCTFKAGICMAGVTDWRFYDSIYTERYMLTPGQNMNGYVNSSALKFTNNLKGRLLLMSGVSDDNVHFYNTLKYGSKLSSEGKVFDMMAYAGFEHSCNMCDARVQLFRKIFDFLMINF